MSTQSRFTSPGEGEVVRGIGSSYEVRWVLDDEDLKDFYETGETPKLCLVGPSLRDGYGDDDKNCKTLPMTVFMSGVKEWKFPSDQSQGEYYFKMKDFWIVSGSLRPSALEPQFSSREFKLREQFTEGEVIVEPKDVYESRPRQSDGANDLDEPDTTAVVTEGVTTIALDPSMTETVGLEDIPGVYTDADGNLCIGGCSTLSIDEAPTITIPPPLPPTRKDPRNTQEATKSVTTTTNAVKEAPQLSDNSQVVMRKGGTIAVIVAAVFGSIVLFSLSFMLWKLRRKRRKMLRNHPLGDLHELQKSCRRPWYSGLAASMGLKAGGPDKRESAMPSARETVHVDGWDRLPGLDHGVVPRRNRSTPPDMDRWKLPGLGEDLTLEDAGNLGASGEAEGMNEKVAELDGTGSNIGTTNMDPEIAAASLRLSITSRLGRQHSLR